MNLPKINPLNQSTNPVTYGPFHELSVGLTEQGNQLQKIIYEIETIKNGSQNVDRLCKAFDMLHGIRLISLISLPLIFSLLCCIYLFVFAKNNEAVLSIVKLLFGGTTIGLLIEAVWLPNKLKEIDKSISNIKGSLDSSTSRLDSIETRNNQNGEQISQLNSQLNATKKPSTKKKA